jgi:transcription initiation factor TFIID subunit 7
MKPGEQKSGQEEAELETQLVLRMPEDSAKVLREAIQTGATNLKDRLNIKLEQDLRYGELRFDEWLYHIKVVDLPTVIESLKTIDLKSFYKTADICQMMICKEDPEPEPLEEESPSKNKKKDSNKVDKKFLWPHGITPPCKNVRKRRFRKTLKKKYVEAPEIEKEVKRLLRVDNEAVNVKWEIIMEDEEVTKSMSDRPNDSKQTKGKKGRPHQHHPSLLNNEDTASNTAGTSRGDVGEHEIFGEELSDSDDDNNPNLDLDIESRMFDGHSDSNNSGNEASGSRLTTEFNRDMFMKPKASETSENFYQNDSDDGDEPPLSQDAAKSKIQELERQLSELRVQRAQLEQQVASIENQTLRQRLQDNLDALLSQILDKEMEMQDLEMNIF